MPGHINKKDGRQVIPTFLVLAFGFFLVMSVISALRTYEAQKLVRMLGPYSSLSDQEVEQQRVSSRAEGRSNGVRVWCYKMVTCTSAPAAGAPAPVW